MSAKLPDNFVDTANQRFEEAKGFWNNWRAEARDSYDFVSGEQWDHQDKLILQEQKRPPVTFNYSEKMIDAVVGAEVANRQEVFYRPRELTDAPLAELWTNAAKWVRDEGNVDDEESDAFKDTLICGMGWTRTSVSYIEDLDGMIRVDRIDPLEVLADPSATKPGLIDRRYFFHNRWVEESVAKRQWPDVLAFSSGDDTQTGAVIDIRQGHRYEGENIDDQDMHKGQVQIRYYECVEQEVVYRVASESNILEIAAADFAPLKKGLDEKGIKYVKQYRNVYYYAYFANDTLLEGNLSPTQEGFTYQCITGKRDRNKNTWYGLTRVMKDPQRWANKWLSQILHIVNSNAKGGLLAEVGAFVDPQRAQDEWSMPESITLLKEGGISKIQQKSMSNYPSGLDRLMEFALSSLPQVTGINLEALGLAGREQANVLEQSRKQAAYGLLSPVFDALRRYRKNQGRILLDFIHNYISDGRMVRIGGPDSQQFIQLTKAPKAPCYDIIVDQSPQAPDVKEKTWQVLSQILPNMLKAGLPLPPDLLDYAPLPAGLALKWKQFAAQNQPRPEQMQQLQQQLQQIQQENMQLKQALQDKSQEFALKQQETAQMLQLKQAEAVGNLKIKEAEVLAAIQRKQMEVNAKISTNLHDVFQSHANDAQANVMSAVNDLVKTVAELKAQEAAEEAQSSESNDA